MNVCVSMNMLVFVLSMGNAHLKCAKIYLTVH